MIVQAVPFHRSMNVLLSTEPTAKHRDALAHPTVDSVGTPVGSALAMIDHAVPFQRSTRVRCCPPTVFVPTAKHVAVSGHATELRRLTVAPAGLGLGTIDHIAPF